MLPWLLVLWGFTPTTGGRPVRPPPRYLVALLAGLPLVYLALRAFVVGEVVGGYGSTLHLTFTPQRLIGPIVSYLARAGLPALRGDPVSVLCFAAIAGLTSVALVRSVRRHARGLLAARGKIPASHQGRRGARIARLGPVGLACASFVVSCLPVVNLGVSLFDSQGERFMYLPTVFSSIGIALLLGLAYSGRRLAAVGASLLLAMTVAVVQSGTQWSRAGSFAEGILRDALVVEARGEVVILNLPDNVNGAYVYRNGFREALELFGHDGRWQPVVITLHALRDGAGEVTASRAGSRMTLTLRNPRSVKPVLRARNWSSFDVRTDPTGFAVTERTRDRLRVELTERLATAPAYATGRSHLYRIDRESG